MNIYQERGFKSRKDYLQNLTLEYDIDPETVFAVADMLGPSEDFDGLVSSLQDFEDW